MEVAASDVVFKNRLNLIPFSDLHFGSKASDEKRFDRLIKWILSKEDTYAIGLGDYSDSIIRQDLKRFSANATKDDMLIYLDNLLNEQRDLVINKLKPLADAKRLLGLGLGNHEHAISKHHSYDMMKDICRELKTPYLGYSFLYRWRIKKASDNTRRNVIIYGHHGFGASRKGGAAMNKREDILCKYDADVILCGHDHHKMGRRLIRLGITSNGEPKIIHKPVIIAATGSFMKTCIQGDTTYAEMAGYPPNDIGVVKITMDIVGKDHNLDIHVSE